jgi:hypothetical protein
VSPSEEPPVRPVVSAEPVLGLERLPGLNGVQPGGPARQHVVGVDQPLPPGAEGDARRQPGVLEDAAVMVGGLPVGAGKLHHVRHGVGNILENAAVR